MGTNLKPVDIYCDHELVEVQPSDFVSKDVFRRFDCIHCGRSFSARGDSAGLLDMANMMAEIDCLKQQIRILARHLDLRWGDE